MIKKDQPPFNLHGLVNGPAHYFDLLAQDHDHYDDAVLATVYIVSEFVIGFIGPLFWVYLIYLFFLAELGVAWRTV